MGRKWLVVAGAVVAGSMADVARSSDIPDWTVVTSTRVSYSPLVLPDLPPFNASWSLGDVWINDVSAEADVHFDLSRNSANELWRSNASGVEPYAVTDVLGALGPSRTGSEAAHVFRWIGTSVVDAGIGGRRVFVGLAGPAAPASTSFSTYGLWVNDGEANTEIARGRLYQPGQASGPLDPGDVDFRFATGYTMVSKAWVVPDGSVVFVANVVPNGGSSSTLAVVRNHPNVGNEVCAVSGESIGSFVNSGVFVGASGDVFVKTNSTNWAVFRVCGLGAPTELVRNGATNELGPALPSPTARFGISGMLHPDGIGGFYFRSSVYDSTTGTWTGEGIFRHVNGLNLPVVRTGLSGSQGSNYNGKPFSHISSYAFDVDVAGNELVFKGGVPPESGSGRINGYWRIGADGKAEPIAIEGSTEPGYSPGSGSAWDLINARGRIFAGGDVLLWGKAYPDSYHSLWRLRRGQRPHRLLNQSDTVEVPISGGSTSASVGTISLVTAALSDVSDTWVNAAGYAVINANLSGFGSVYLKGLVADVDYIFANGVEGY